MTRNEKIAIELNHAYERLAYNERMRYEAPPRSRFAYAAHVTRLRNKIARLEAE